MLPGKVNSRSSKVRSHHAGKIMLIKSSYNKNANDKLTKSSGTPAALRMMESCSSTIRFTAELRNSDDAVEPPAAATGISLYQPTLDR